MAAFACLARNLRRRSQGPETALTVYAHRNAALGTNVLEGLTPDLIGLRASEVWHSSLLLE